jgi:hypothetical protein
MKPVPLSFAAVILALLSCSSVQSAPQDSLQDKVTKLEIQLTQKLDKANAVYDRLIEDFLKLERRVAGLESENQMLKIDIKRLTERVEQQGSSGSGRPAPAPGADVGIKIDQALAKLKTTENVDEAAKELIPLAPYSVAKLMDALRQISSLAYVASVEKVVAKFPVNELKGPLEEAGRDRVRRSSVARIIAAVGNGDLSKILEPYAGDSDPITQVEIGEALLACKNKAGVPPLLKALGAAESELRFRAILSLKRLNKGETFGFDMNKNADDNAAAIKAWHDWWTKEGPKLFE